MMSDSDASSGASARCPVCDFKVKAGAERCLMCGADLPASIFTRAAEPKPGEETAAATSVLNQADAHSENVVAEAPQERPVQAAEPRAIPLPARTTEDEYEPLGEVVEMTLQERVAPITTLMVIAFAILTVGLGALILPAAMAAPVSLAFFPTTTPLPPTVTLTPTITPMPSQTPAPTQTPTIMPTPSPIPTLRPPFSHQVAPGETLFSLSFVYNVSVDSIATLNQFAEGAFLVQGQEILIPHPTATPPLASIIIELDGQTFVADPGGCQRYEIQSNDSIVSIGAAYDVDYRAILAVNRLDTNSLIQPGQTLCIPDVSFFDGELPPTPGPSPTPLPTLPPAGAQLMFPPAEARFAPDETVLLQWAAVADLAADEYYLVELIDLDDFGRYPQRAYTRDNSFRVPLEWRSAEPEEHRYQWRVTIVRVIGGRQDGGFIRAFAGLPSAPRHFFWAGQ